MSSIFIFKGISYSTSTDCGFEAAFYVISPSVVVAKKSANPRRIRQHARRVRYPAIRVNPRNPRSSARKEMPDVNLGLASGNLSMCSKETWDG